MSWNSLVLVAMKESHQLLMISTADFQFPLKKCMYNGPPMFPAPQWCTDIQVHQGQTWFVSANVASELKKSVLSNVLSKLCCVDINRNGLNSFFVFKRNERCLRNYFFFTIRLISAFLVCSVYFEGILYCILFLFHYSI